MAPFGVAITSRHGQTLLFLSMLRVLIQVHLTYQQAPVANDLQNFKILVPNLPPDHYQFWLKNHPRAFKVFEQICAQITQSSDLNNLKKFQELHSNLTFEDPIYLQNLERGRYVLDKICSKIKIIPKSCWGYENNCHEIHLMPECSGAKNEQQQKIDWFGQVDFGYILERRKELDKYCSPNKHADSSADSFISSLECTRNFTTCRGENLFIQFNIPKEIADAIESKGQNLIKKGDIGGWNCDLQEKRISEEDGQTKRMQSWFNELKNYNLMHNEPSQVCDKKVDNQTFLVKLDTTNDLYDFINNFINLYATIHLNNKFSDDNQIVVWGSKLPGGNMFDQIWPAFSRYPPVDIGHYNGTKVCFKKFIFVMPPKMVDGLLSRKSYVTGCSKSGLFNAFNRHILHRLRITQLNSYFFKTRNDIIRVVILSRAVSGFRAILNEDKLESALRNTSQDIGVQLINYKMLEFRKVLNYASNTDILIGMHGSGLTLSLFLPEWAVVMELDDCADTKYQHLARLRGVTYMSGNANEKLIKKYPVPESSSEWERLNELKLLDDDKFSNYEVDENEFLALFRKAEEKVKRNRERHFKEFESKLIKTGMVSSTTRNTPAPQATEPPVDTTTENRTHSEL